MKAIFFFFFFISLLISSKPIPSSSTRINYNRRILHQPFFPINSHPPTSQVQPPLSSPPPQQQTKYPFSSLSPPNNKKNPFFPLYPNSPPQPSSTTTTTTLPTFPANISSLILPPSASSSKPISKKLVTVAVCLSLLSAALISGIAAALLHHRRPPTFKESRTDSLRLFPPNTTTSDGGHILPRLTPAWSVSGNSSEFLYLGTLRGLDEDIHQVSNSSNAGASSGYQKLGSPELHPLPPLPPRHSFRQSYRNYQVGSREFYEQEEEEEFFSPRGSSGCKDQSPDSISQRGFDGVEAQNSRTASYLSSNSASPIHSLNLSPRSLRSKSPDSLAGFQPPFRPPPAIPLPPPPPPPKFWEIPVVRRGLNGDPITGPPVAGPVDETQRPKLKPLHWDKVRASSDRAMVWDQLKSSSFQ